METRSPFLCLVAVAFGCVSEPGELTPEDLGQSSLALEESESEDACFTDADCPDGESCVEGTCGSCGCPIVNPTDDWCVGQTAPSTCILGACYKTDPVSGDCHANFTGAYCGCHVKSSTVEYVSPPILTAEASCVSAGPYAATKLYKKAAGDTARPGYDSEDCNWTP